MEIPTNDDGEFELVWNEQVIGRGQVDVDTVTVTLTDGDNENTRVFTLIEFEDVYRNQLNHMTLRAAE